MEEDTSFVNMDNWKGNNSNNLSFKQITLQQIKTCVQNGSVDWHVGGWKQIQKNNCTEDVYVENTREIYQNSVRMLRVLLLPTFDKQMNNADKELQEEHTSTEKETTNQLKEKKEDNLKSEIKKEWISYNLEWHIKLFEQLILLSKRLNFFEEEANEGGA